ncbi:MAG: NAD-dependent epimerase/dehydratase family protein [Sciscionella sp.]
MTQRFLITGAGGLIGGFLRARLARPDRVLRLLDVVEIDAARHIEAVETIQADVTNMAAMEVASAGVDVVIHLAAKSTETTWDRLLHTNIHGTYVVLEAARRAGVGRVIVASSNHVVGSCPWPEKVAPDYAFPRPDSFYGVSKATNEALASLFHDRYGMDILCVRIGSCRERPHDERMLSTWLSPDDCARLMEALIVVSHPGFRVLWGVSANTRGVASLEEARVLGYEPGDDAERFADEVLAGIGRPGVKKNKIIGGDFGAFMIDK